MCEGVPRVDQIVDISYRSRDTATTAVLNCFRDVIEYVGEVFRLHLRFKILQIVNFW